jgi:RNA polymerase sigma-70 factor, ECF subfamily
LHDVHRSTAARWIAEAREAIVDDTKSLLQARLGSTPSEIQSILTLVKSRLDVSFRRLLRVERAPCDST